MRAEVAQQAEEDDEAEEDEEFGAEVHDALPFSSAFTAATAAASASGIRRAADQPLDDRAGRVVGDRADVRHRLRRGVAAICASAVGEFGRELSFERLALGVGFGGELVARRLGEALRLGAGFGERLLMRGGGGVGLLLHRGRLVDVLGDARLARLDHRADLRQRASWTCSSRARRSVIASHSNCEGNVLGVERREVGVAGLVADFRSGSLAGPWRRIEPSRFKCPVAGAPEGASRDASGNEPS